MSKKSLTPAQQQIVDAMQANPGLETAIATAIAAATAMQGGAPAPVTTPTQPQVSQVPAAPMQFMQQMPQQPAVPMQQMQQSMVPVMMGNQVVNMHPQQAIAYLHQQWQDHFNRGQFAQAGMYRQQQQNLLGQMNGFAQAVGNRTVAVGQQAGGLVEGVFGLLGNMLQIGGTLAAGVANVVGGAVQGIGNASSQAAQQIGPVANQGIGMAFNMVGNTASIMASGQPAQGQGALPQQQTQQQGQVVMINGQPMLLVPVQQ